MGSALASHLYRIRYLTVSTFVVALLGYATLVATARILGPEMYANFAVLWGTYFAATGLLFGLQQEVTRAVASVAPRGAPTDSLVLTRVMTAAAPLVISILIGAAVWTHTSGDSSTRIVGAAMAVALAALGVQSSVVGALAGRARWNLVARVALVSAVIRTVAVLSLVSVAAADAWLVFAIGCGAFGWLFLPRAQAASALHERTPDGTAIFLRRSGSVLVSSGCAALLAAGFPLLLATMSTSGLDDSAGVFLAAVVLTRTPLLLPLNALQLVLLQHLTRDRHASTTLLARVLLFVALAGCVAAAIAALIGPWALRVMFGPAFQLSGPVMTGLVIGAMALVTLTITGTALLAQSQHRASAFGWVGAVLATCAALLTGGEVESRGVVALVFGPLCGAALHGLFLLRRIPVPK